MIWDMHYLIADLAADFRRKYPDVRLRLVGLNSSEVADQVRDATLEAGLIVLPVDDAGMARAMIKPLVSFYIGGMGHPDMHFHVNAFDRMGFGDQARRVRDWSGDA